jgi:tetratricopeptide (TPR) repeat protein/signal transduction histidine kinase
MHNRALERYQGKKDLPNVSATYNLMGNACLRLNKFNEAIGNYTQSVNYSVQAGDSAGVARTLNNLSRTLARNGKTDEAIANLNRALNIWQNLRENANVAIIYNELGATYRNVNNYTKAIENFQMALQIRREISDIQQIAATLNNIGTIYKDINMPETALEYYEEALTIHQRLSNESLIALSLNYIGGVYYKKGQFDHALDYYLSALGYYEVIDDKIENARIQNNIALMYKNLGNFEKSFEYYGRSLELYQQLTDHKSTADILNNIGNLYMVQKKLKPAREYFLQSQQIRKDIRDFRGLARTNFDLALVDAENKRFKDAIKHLQLAWNERRVDLGYEMRRDLARKMSEFFEAEKDFKLALLYRKNYEAYYDSLINQDLLLKLTEVKTQNEAEKLQFTRAFEIEKKEAEVKAIIREQQTKELMLMTENRLQKFIRNLFILLAVAAIIIALLLFSRFLSKSRINAELKMANEHLQKLNDELVYNREQLALSGNTKDKLLNIILHDLKNPFISFLYAAELTTTRDSGNVSPETVRSFIHSSSAMYNLLESLVGWSKRHTSVIEPQFREFYPHALAEEVLELFRFQSAVKNVTIINRLPRDLSFYGDTDMFSFVIRNLVGYSLQSLKENKFITINYTSENGQHKISVADDGGGVPNQKMFKMLNSTEENTEQNLTIMPDSVIGLYFCREFVKQWHGGFFVDCKINKGTNFEFTLPLHTDKLTSRNS